MLNDSFALPDNMRRLRLTSDYCFGIFDCGNADLNDFLFQDAKLHSKYLHYVTYILEAGDQIIAYYSIANDKIQVSEVDDFWGQQAGEGHAIGGCADGLHRAGVGAEAVSHGVAVGGAAPRHRGGSGGDATNSHIRRGQTAGSGDDVQGVVVNDGIG